jgi:quercetin dioxygenase-like cupin family protein
MLNTFLLLLLAANAGGAQNGNTSPQLPATDEKFLLTYPNLVNSQGEVVLENTYVVVQRLVVPAGKWEGVHSHPGNQVYVHIHGGEWSGQLGGEYEYRGAQSPDGSVGWMDEIPFSAGHNSGNTGDTDIDLIYVTLKDDEPIAPNADHKPQTYPGVDAEVLLENDRMIVQRVFLEPGQWTGVHSHPGNQVYLQIKGGTWSQREGGGPAGPAESMEPGAVGWVDAVDIGAAHEEGNTGDTTMEFVLVTIK